MQNTSYTYSVQWVNGPNVGTASTATVTTPYAAAGVISGLTGAQTATGVASVTLRWTAPAAGTVTSYTVTRCLQSALNANCTNASTVFAVLSSTVTAATFVDTTVASNSAYTYQVIASNGPINKSVPATVSVAIVTTLAAPAFTAVPVISAGSVSVNWSASAAPVTGYAVQRSADNGLTWAQVGTTASRTTTAFADATVVAGTTYLYRIVATETVGSVLVTSSPSATQTAAYIVQAAPVMAASVYGGTAARPTVQLNWTETANAGPAVTGFQVYRDGVLVTTTARNAVTYTDTTVPGLHTYTVLTMNLVGPSAFTATTTANLVVQAIPVLASANMSSATVAALAWSQTPDITAPAVTGYQVWASVNGAAAVQMGANLAATATSANVTIVSNNNYVFSVKAVNQMGSSAASNSVTLLSQVQAAPVQTAASFTSATSVTLGWTETAIAANPAVTGFNVYGGTAGTTLLTTTPLAANATSYVATTAVGNNYSFIVKAVNLAGMSVASNAVSVSNTVPTAPGAPALVAGSVARSGTTSNDTANVTWTPVADTVNGWPVTSYIVQTASNTGFTTNLSAVTVAVPAGGLTGLQTTSVFLPRGTATTAAGTDYVRVIAVNAVGQSATSTANRLTVATASLK